MNRPSSLSVRRKDTLKFVTALYVQHNRTHRVWRGCPDPHADSPIHMLYQYRRQPANEQKAGTHHRATRYMLQLGVSGAHWGSPRGDLRGYYLLSGLDTFIHHSTALRAAHTSSSQANEAVCAREDSPAAVAAGRSTAFNTRGIRQAKRIQYGKAPNNTTSIELIMQLGGAK